MPSMTRDTKQRIADYVALLPMSVKHPVLDQLEEFDHELVRRLTADNGGVNLRTITDSTLVKVCFTLCCKGSPRYHQTKPKPILLFEVSFNAANGPVDIKVMESEAVACKDLNLIQDVIWEQLEKIENRRALYRFATKPIIVDDEEESDADQMSENG